MPQQHLAFVPYLILQHDKVNLANIGDWENYITRFGSFVMHDT